MTYLPPLLIKFFDEDKFADAFLNYGEMYCRKLGEFLAMEKENGERGDKYEGISGWHQPSDVRLSIEFEEKKINIGKNELAGPIIIQKNALYNLKLFCLFHVSPIEITEKINRIYNTEAEFIQAQQAIANHIEEQLNIDERLLNFGTTAVLIHNTKQYFQLISDYVKVNNIEIEHRPVQYFDPKTFSGSFEGVDGAFCKRKKYDYQREYRLAFWDATQKSKNIFVHVGSLTNIAIKISASEIQKLSIKFKKND